MIRLIFITLLLFCLQACITSNEAAQNQVNAGRQEELAEIEREKGNEAMARIYEDSARRNRKSSSFTVEVIDFLFESILD